MLRLTLFVHEPIAAELDAEDKTAIAPR
jgi:hypothetical protein